ncbi:bifunctional 2-polyprenyl-6-hydroxyphenol methylase/3-demethylubiquinol 3-O-methyltransferase UbiG [Stappia sp. ES.058]|uniref:class I SAM-dependent methyltransferase n=1 Tax=Stappia sp. ES.058 TaxID=1881061 RepID=UPI00087CF26B|nr:class I SAM-dependent methyltransferase [Stappia sp. ES.058]SDU44273.1 Methyltransferase domain-containing protein [Stappia sp. ES.058]
MTKSTTIEEDARSTPEDYMTSLQRYYSDLYAGQPICTRGYRNLRAIEDYYDALCQPSAPRSMLDIGCGQGELTAFFADRGALALGVDLIENPLWAGLVETRAGRLAFQAGDFMEATFTDCFDVIVDSGCFHHQHPDVQPLYLDKIRTLVTPERGKFVLSLFETNREIEDDGIQVMRDGRFARTASLDWVAPFLGEHGFTVRETLRVPREDGTPYCLVVHAE